MPKYLHHVRYTAEGKEALVEAGGSTRREAAVQTIEGIGGQLEAFYFAFGPTDAFVIAELPDNATAEALALTIGSSGRASVETVALLTPEELDDAAHKSIEYRPPGK